MNATQVFAARVASGACVLVALEWLARAGAIPAVVMPPPTQIASGLWQLLPTDGFHDDLLRTLSEALMSCVIGIVLGLLLGAACAQRRRLGDVLEPFLVTLYATPTLTFYPLLLAVMGLGAGPIVAITSTMVAVPVALNTMVGIREINPTLRKLGRALACSRRRMLLSILLPAAAPLLFPGIKLGVIYAVIGVIAMEFILANMGLGYRIGYEYNNFAIPAMWANILAVVVISVAAVAALSFIERRVRRDLA